MLLLTTVAGFGVLASQPGSAAACPIDHVASEASMAYSAPSDRPDAASRALVDEPIAVSLVILPATPTDPSSRLHVSFSADHLLVTIFGISLLGMFVLYRRETDVLNKLRLAAALGLVAVIFLCTSLALPWTEAPSASNAFNLCSLGHEAFCVGASAAESGLSYGETAFVLTKIEWAASGIRAGQISLILLFLPACLWLLVSPASRGAQALVCGGAVSGLFLVLATLSYLDILWWDGIVRERGAADVTLLASIGVLGVACAVIGNSRRSRPDSGPELPPAWTHDPLA